MGSTQQFGVRDLLAVAAIIALHFAAANRFAAFPTTVYMSLFLFTVPLGLTALLQWRFRLGWRLATIAHYPLSVLWGFMYGLALHIALTSRSHHWHDLGTNVFVEPRMQFAVTSAKFMGLVAIGTTVLYAGMSWLLHTRVLRQSM